MKFELSSLDDYSDDALIRELQRVARLVVSRDLTRREFSRHSQVHEATIRRRFGGWLAALEAAGLVNRADKSNARIATERMLATLKEIATIAPNGCVTRKFFDENAPFTSCSVIRRFGTWKNAIQTAGINLSKHGHRYSDNECFENLLRVWTKLGRQPKYREMNNEPSTIKAKPYVTRWGSWRNALRAFADSMNSNATSDAADAIPVVDSPATSTAHTVANDQGPRITPLRMRYRVLVRDSFRCKICGRSPATHPEISLEIDHVIPYSRSGCTTLENLRSLCNDCNSGKGDLEVEA